MSYPLALYAYVTSVCWQTENVRTPSPYAARPLDERDLAGTTLQNLWDRCDPLSRLSERDNVQSGLAASRSMPRSLVVEINPMNPVPTNKSTSRENDIPFRHGSLLPKTTILCSSRPSVSLFFTSCVLETYRYRYKRANTAPDSSACR